MNASEWAMANPWRTSMIGTQVMKPNAAIVWQNWNIDSMMVRLRYCGPNISVHAPRACTGSACS